MKITEKKIGKTGLILEAKVDYTDYSNALESSLKDYRKKVNIPGFRSGKVPMSLVKKKYELPVKVEEINKLLSSAIQNYITEKKISIIGGPIPVDNKIDFEKSNDYVFEYELGLKPTIDLSKAEKSKVDFWIIDPSIKEVKEHIEGLTKRFGQVTQVEKMQKDDMLNVRFEELEGVNKKVDGISHSTSLLVSKIADNTIRDKFLKLKVNESISIAIHKAFTNHADIASMLNISKDEVKSLKSDFACTINTINRLIPADLNKDFYKKVYPEKDIKNEKDFKKVIKDELSSRYLKESDRKLFNDGSALFLEKTKVDLPDEFLKKWLKMNAKKEFLEAEFEKEYQNYVKYLSWQLIENKICEENSIKITNEKLSSFTKDHVLEQMKNYGNINMGSKEIEGIVKNILNNKQEAEKMTNELVLIELVQYFKSKMKLKKNTVTLDEFIKLASNQK
jgi:trigger factor